ncbi:PREDICTED: putative F-box protein At3g20030 isoform X3 [Brassica oleracea var. oleracea]|uniref:putative F-box protein At3g20030 isoform X3 n=1 Tax=Brassica oleracea var. oleracea TaxID=109376 RepID=UPI0006A6ECF9|nr:PREDICTED: putative F-box protein At3g20030 isoform X3 [Brassica oleracea var. oleracea]
MTTISDLSLDLVEKIVYRVPITSIGAVRSTCKLLNRLCKNRIWLYLEEKRHQFLGFMVKNYKLCLIKFYLHGILDEEEFVDPSIKGIIGDSLLNQVDVTKVFHCDGLLLCVTKDKEEVDRTSLVVWNPYLGQIRWIQRPRNNYHRLDSSDSWRVLNITPDYDTTFFQRGVSLKGNAYFFATEKLRVVTEEEYTPEPHKFLICFDFTIESFGPPLPLPFNLYTGDTGTLSSLRDEKLAALYQCCDMAEVEIWVTTKIEVPNALSWIPFLRIDLEPFTGFDLQFQHGGASFFIEEEKKIAVVFHLDSSDQMTYYDSDHEDLIGENGSSEITCNDTAYIIGENGYFQKVGLGEGVSGLVSTKLQEAKGIDSQDGTN